MHWTHLVSIALAIVYIAFFSWYTSFGGPLTDDEIAHHLELFERRGGDPERLATLKQFMLSDDGDDFVMVNLIEFNEPPKMIEGVRPGETAQQVLSKYMDHMWPQLLRRACHPVAPGEAASRALDLWGIEGAEQWSMAAFMRYRSRRDMLEIASDPAFRGPHRFKEAAMAKTVAFPIAPWVHFGDPRALLAGLFVVLGLALQLWRVRSSEPPPR